MKTTVLISAATSDSHHLDVDEPREFGDVSCALCGGAADGSRSIVNTVVCDDCAAPPVARVEESDAEVRARVEESAARWRSAPEVIYRKSGKTTWTTVHISPTRTYSWPRKITAAKALELARSA